ncbi:MAG: hypothetical protein IKK34_13180 [Clostridia bacterium]|nr:hypothetical protein [Clostridia bacterium]
MTEEKKNAWLTALLLVLIGVSIFLLNAHTPLMMDDYDYSFSWSTGERLSGLADILASQAVHYRQWGGRSVVHFFAQLFLYLGKPVFNAANTLMYQLLLIEIVYLGGKREMRSDWRLLMIAHVLLFFTVPFFGVTFLWLDGACNYLWGTALALLPLIIGKSERESGFFDTESVRGWLALPLCFLAGWTNENTACGVLAACLLLLIWDAYSRRGIRAWRIASLIAQALGVMVLLLAPGNFVRPSEPSGRSMIMELLYRAAVVTYCGIRYAGIPAIAALGLFAAAYRRKTKVRSVWFAVLCGAALLCAYALVGSPQISDRTFTGVLALAIAALLSACADVMKKPGKKDAAAGLLLMLCVTCSAGLALRDVKAHEAAWRAQEERILSAAGEEQAVISSVLSDSRFTMDIVIAQDAAQWPNSTLSRYYGIEIMGQ